MQTVVKGAVQAAGTTYRAEYDAVRPVLREVVRVAIRHANTTFVGRVALG